MGEPEEHAIHSLACARDERSARADNQREVFNYCGPAIQGIYPLCSQESLVHEEAVEKEFDSSVFSFRHGDQLKRKR
jgi:hypothetical protein